MDRLIKALSAFACEDQILVNEPMSRRTTFRVGGPADVLFLPQCGAQVLRALEAARSAGVPAHVIGNGSNLLVRDGGIRGLVIALGEGMSTISREGDVVAAQAGASLARVAAFAQAEGLSGLEFASGIPGTLGGGCAMNAGAYGGQLSDALIDAEVLLDGGVLLLQRHLQRAQLLLIERDADVDFLHHHFLLYSDDFPHICCSHRGTGACN